MHVIGKIRTIEETKVTGEKNYKSRNLIIETEEQYPQIIPVQFSGDKCDELNNYQVGQKVRATVSFKGKEYIKDGKPLVFLTLSCWKIEHAV